ncbi:hypothetical protein BKA62DRAFT_774953 [Auriculariales sp. MPI-PUGE-AT-0066]|nr:hypothetical protein BKA62DRAFT_774953 [Auriculariales sp. MPI-PUGE-AT-0066]
MTVVPGELLSGCMRTGTGAVAREKLENVLAANNKVLAPYNSSSEDEFSSYSSDSHYPTIRRRAMRTIGVMTPIASTHVSLKVKKTVTNVATAETDAIPFGPLSSASSGTASLPSPSPGLSSRTSTSLKINAHTANALLQSQPKPQPNVYTKVDNEPTTAIEPRTLAQHKPPQTPDTPYSGYYGSSETDSSPGCVHTPASLSRAAYFQADETAVLEGTSGGGGLASQSGTIRARRRATGPGSRSASRNRTPKRSPEREKSHTSPTQTMREREAALFKVALERTQGRRGGTLARSRPRAKAMFDLSSESDSSEE